MAGLSKYESTALKVNAKEGDAVNIHTLLYAVNIHTLLFAGGCCCYLVMMEKICRSLVGHVILSKKVS